MKQLLFILLLLNFFYGYGQETFSDSIIISSFKQGIGDGFIVGNCSSISVIKSAIQKYGLHKVLLHVDTLSNLYQVKLRDGKTIELTKDEEAALNEIDFFSEPHNTSVYTEAKFFYAVMVKNKYLENPENYSNVVDAGKRKRFLHKTVYLLGDTEPNLKYLGLENSYDIVSVDNVNSSKNIILTNYYHSAYSSNGIYDEYGTPTPNSDFVDNHGGSQLNADGIYRLKD